jgi:hypothetical protein
MVDNPCLDRIYYDWSSQRWSILPQTEDIDGEDEIYQDWIDELEAKGDKEQLAETESAFQELIGRLETDIQDAFENDEDK